MARSVAGAGRGKGSSTAAFIWLQIKIILKVLGESDGLSGFFMVSQLNQLLSKPDMPSCHFFLVLGSYMAWLVSQRNTAAVVYRVFLIQNPSSLPTLHLVNHRMILEVDFITNTADSSQRPIYSQLLTFRK